MTQKRRVRAKWAHITLVVAAVLLAAAGAVWIERVALVTWAATRQFERQGLGPVALVVDDVDLHGFHAHDLALRGGALRLRALSAAYEPFELLGRHLERVDLVGLEIAADLGPEGLSFDGKPLSGAGDRGALPDWRIDSVAVSEARMTLRGHTASPVEATISTTLTLAGGTMSCRNIAAMIALSTGGVRRTVRVTAESMTIAPGMVGRPLLGVAQASVTPDDLLWAAKGIDATVVALGDRLTAQIGVGELVNLERPALLSPLRLSAEASLNGADVEIMLHAATVAPSSLSLEVKGRYDRSSSSGSAALSMAPLLFHPGSFQPADLFPVLAGAVEDVKGSISLSGSIVWNKGSLSPKLVLRLDDLAFATAAVQFRALTGAIALNRLWPPTTPPGQSLTAVIEASGLPPAKLSVGGQLTAKPVVRFERLAAEFADGEIMAAPFSVDPAALAIDTVLAVDHVDLAAVTKLLSIDGLSGTGTLDGRIPVHFSQGKLTIAGGKLSARAPGTLGYAPQKLPSEFAATGESVELALRVLSDFHYNRLSLDLDKSASGEGTVVLRLQGNNPAVLAGQAFNFNIRVESNFDRLADLALLSLRSAQELLRRGVGRARP